MKSTRIGDREHPALGDLTERELVKQIKNGDDSAFNKLAEYYGRIIFNIGLRMLNNREDAADMAQETLIKIYRNIGNFRGDAALSTWIYRVSVNTCRDMLRMAYRKRETPFCDFNTENESSAVFETPDPNIQPDDICLDNEAQSYLVALISSLAPVFRMTLALREISGLSYQEIAIAMNVSIGTVKSRINRARAAMREKLMQDAEQFPQLLRQFDTGGDEEDAM